MSTADDTEARRTVEAIFRIESPRLIAGLARLVRDVGVAEELAQDALVAALEQWPAEGVPDKPGAWLMATAKHRAIDSLRRRTLQREKYAAIEREAEIDLEVFDDASVEQLDDEIGDDLLRLMFTACHPLLSTEARVALTLRLLGGLTTDEIARAYLVSEPTIAQRIVRAKRTLGDARVPFELPRKAELGERLASVLEVIYLIFNEGYAATAGDDWLRPALCEDALRLARVLAGLAPDEPEVHGLVGAPRDPAVARRGAHGFGRRAYPVARSGSHALGPALDTPRAGIARARRAARGRGTRVRTRLQAAIAACHARAATADATDWPRIAALYGALAGLDPSPVVELNRAVAVSMAEGPAAGLALDG